MPCALLGARCQFRFPPATYSQADASFASQANLPIERNGWLPRNASLEPPAAACAALLEPRVGGSRCKGRRDGEGCVHGEPGH